MRRIPLVALLLIAPPFARADASGGAQDALIGVLGDVPEDIFAEMTSRLSEPRRGGTARLGFVEGRLSGKRVVAAMTGDGMDNAVIAAQAMIDRHRIGALIVFGGAAGLMAEAAAPGRLDIPSAWLTHDYEFMKDDARVYLGVHLSALPGRASAPPRSLREFPVDPGMLEAARRGDRASRPLPDQGLRRREDLHLAAGRPEGKHGLRRTRLHRDLGRQEGRHGRAD